MPPADISSSSFRSSIAAQSDRGKSRSPASIVRSQPMSVRSGGQSCLTEIAVLGRFCANLTGILSGFGPLRPAPGACGWTIELPNFVKML
jgi:hypothetical protein